MKSKAVPIIAAVSVILIAAAFFAGRYVNEKNNRRLRESICEKYLSFAMDKAEKEELSDEAVMDALISNVYAAYTYCDYPDLGAQLHEIWNTLIFRSDEYINRTIVLIERLTMIQEAMSNRA